MFFEKRIVRHFFDFFDIKLKISDSAWSTRRFSHAIQQDFREQDFSDT